MASHKESGGNDAAGTSQGSASATAVLIQVLESDELYLKQHERKLSPHDVELINEYVSKLPKAEWEAFKAHCMANQLDPLKEMRELILMTYMRNFVLSLKQKQREGKQV